MIRAGKLDRNIIFERATTAVDANGTATETWTPLANVRAELVENAIDEHQREFGASTQTTITFRVRYVAGITVADRLTYEGQPLNIIGLKELGRRRGLEIRATATGA